MTFPAAEEPRLSTTGEQDETVPAEEQDAAGPEPPGAGSLSEKPVLEWTTEDWARWIEEPPGATRPPHDSDFFGADQREPAEAAAAPQEEARVDADATAAWSVGLDEAEDDDARWWSSVAGLTDAAPPVDPPAPAIEPPAPPVAPPAPPVGAGTEVFRRLPQSTGSPEPARSPPASPSRGHSLDPHGDDLAVRVRAGLSLLGVSVLVGAVAAGLITVAIFLAAVVLRRALG